GGHPARGADRARALGGRDVHAPRLPLLSPSPHHAMGSPAGSVVAPRAVVLLSGGLDSTTTLAIALAEGYECCALSFDYGQRHVRELEAARQVATALGARPHLTLRLDLRAIGGPALTAALAVPHGRRREPTRTLVPAPP